MKKSGADLQQPRISSHADLLTSPSGMRLDLMIDPRREFWSRSARACFLQPTARDAGPSQLVLLVSTSHVQYLYALGWRRGTLEIGSSRARYIGKR